MLPHPLMHLNVKIKFDDDISLGSFEKVLLLVRYITLGFINKACGY